MDAKTPPSVLGAGHYYGSTTRRRAVSGVLLTEALYPIGHRTPAHVHERAYFSFVLQGSPETIKTKGSLHVGTSALMFHPPRALHLGQVRNMAVDPFLTRSLPDLFERVNDHLKLQNKSMTIHGGLTNRLSARLYREFCQMDSTSEIAIEGLVLEMLAQCTRDHAQFDKNRPPRFVTVAREIIHVQYSGKLSLAVIAKLVDIHPVYLATEFRRCFHCTVGDYIRRLRIDTACREIAKLESSLAEIAVGLGFSHQAHFTRTFKDHVGITPSLYRKHFRDT